MLILILTVVIVFLFIRVMQLTMMNSAIKKELQTLVKKLPTIAKKNELEREKLVQIKNEFVSVVSHELRTPLTAIHGAMTLLSKDIAGKLTKQDDDLLNIALNNINRLIRLINDILDIEKIELNKMNFVLKQYNIINVIQEAIASNQPYADKFAVKLKLIKKIPAITVNVDHDRIIQVVTNLLANAIKFSAKNREVIITISLKNATKVRVEIIDEGLGIPIEFQKNVFEKFSQADCSEKRGAQGSGLGLYISKAIIEQMGGAIGFVSEAGKGATFYFDLPVCKVD